MMRTWPSRFPAGICPALCRQAGGSGELRLWRRMGNQLNGTNDNDGWDCRGGGLIQHTGRAEYDLLLYRLGMTSAHEPAIPPMPTGRCRYARPFTGYCGRPEPRKRWPSWRQMRAEMMAGPNASSLPMRQPHVAPCPQPPICRTGSPCALDRPR
jgi:hypothetical protein